MVAECKVCGCGLDDQDVCAAGMEEICGDCWTDRDKERTKQPTKIGKE